MVPCSGPFEVQKSRGGCGEETGGGDVLCTAGIAPLPCICLWHPSAGLGVPASLRRAPLGLGRMEEGSQGQGL